MPEKEAQHHRDAGEMPVNSSSANLLKWLKTDKNHGPTQLLVTMQRNRDPHKRQWNGRDPAMLERGPEVSY